MNNINKLTLALLAAVGCAEPVVLGLQEYVDIVGGGLPGDGTEVSDGEGLATGEDAGDDPDAEDAEDAQDAQDAQDAKDAGIEDADDCEYVACTPTCGGTLEAAGWASAAGWETYGPAAILDPDTDSLTLTSKASDPPESLGSGAILPGTPWAGAFTVRITLALDGFSDGAGRL